MDQADVEMPNGGGRATPRTPTPYTRVPAVITIMAEHFGVRLPARERAILVSAIDGKRKYERKLVQWTPTSVGQKPDLGMFPMAAMQEPSKGARANCTFKMFRQPKAVGLSGSRPVTLVAIYTTEPISGDSELFVHYGNEKKRDYVASRAARGGAVEES
jgi:hypothetical protein